MKTKYLIIICFTFVLSGAKAQYSFNSLDSVWQFALSNNKDYNTYQLQVKQAQEEKKIAQSYLYPTISTVASGQDNLELNVTPVPGDLIGRPGETVDMKFGKKYNYNVGLSFNYDILSWQKIFQGKMAQTNVLLKEASLDYFEQDLKEQIGHLYYAYLTSQKALKIGEYDVAIADTLLTLSEDRFRQGTIDAIELNKARISRNKVIQQLEQTRQYNNECISNLKNLLGVELSDIIEFEDHIEFYKKENIIPEIRANSVYLQMYKLQNDYAVNEKKKAMYSFFPNVQLDGWCGANQFQDSFTFSTSFDDWQSYSYIGFTISMPLFTGKANHSNYKAAKLKQNIANNNYLNEIRKSEINDQLLYNKMISNDLIVKAGEENYEMSAENLKLSTLMLNQGLVSIDVYLKVFDDYLIAENNFLNSLSEFLSSVVIFKSRNSQN